MKLNIVKHIIRFVIVLIALFALEWGIRFTGSQRTYPEIIGKGYFTYYDSGHHSWYYGGTPNDTNILDHGAFRFEYLTNSYGFRERQLGLDSSEIRIFIFGDSYVDGVGAEYEESFPRKVEQLLKNEGRSVSVYNFGVSGADPFFNYMSYKDLFLKYDPTHVIFTVNFSDFVDHIYRGGFDRFREDGTCKYNEAPWFHEIYKKSHLARAVMHNILGYHRTLIKKRNIYKYIRKAADEIKACMDKAYSLSEEQSIEFMLLTFPAPWEICKKKLKDLDIYLMNDYTYEYPFIEIAEEFRLDSDSEDCMEIGWESEGHFNAKGYEELGTYVYEAVRRDHPDFWNHK